MSFGRLMISAAGSGHGKSVVTMGLLEAMKERGIPLRSFKCGPDYIDPRFHERVLGIPCRNLDTYLMGNEEVLEEVSDAQDAGCLCVAEGAMGLMDGLGGTSEHSAYSIASLCGMRVIAVLDAGRLDIDVMHERKSVIDQIASEKSAANLRVAESVVTDQIASEKSAANSKAAESTASEQNIAEQKAVDCVRQLQSLLQHDKNGIISGVLINRCLSGEYAVIAKRLKDVCGMCVCGYLPPMPEAVFPSRHLGLVGASEAEDFSNRVHRIGQELEKSGCVERILKLVCGECSAQPEHIDRIQYDKKRTSIKDGGYQCRIAVACDEAFAFLYHKSLDNLRRAGAEVCFFSPLHDACLPDGAAGLYLPGGYPELYAKQLQENSAMRCLVREAVLGGMPTVAECGGFLYLGHELCAEDGTLYTMTGVFRGSASDFGKLVRFGYLEIVQERGDSLLFRQGECITAHEFHYWDSTDNGEDLLAVKRSKNQTWRFGYVSDTMYAGFPHLYLNRQRAERFVSACMNYDF